jgi:hypothetical protein
MRTEQVPRRFRRSVPILMDDVNLKRLISQGQFSNALDFLKLGSLVVHARFMVNSKLFLYSDRAFMPNKHADLEHPSASPCTFPATVSILPIRNITAMINLKHATNSSFISACSSFS